MIDEKQRHVAVDVAAILLTGDDCVVIPGADGPLAERPLRILLAVHQSLVRGCIVVPREHATELNVFGGQQPEQDFVVLLLQSIEMQVRISAPIAVRIHCRGVLEYDLDVLRLVVGDIHGDRLGLVFKAFPDFDPSAAWRDAGSELAG